MVIFDAAGFHTAGSLNPGAQRLVLRGHCLVTPTLRMKLFDRIRKSALNILKYIQTEDELVHDRFKSKSSADVIRKMD